MQATLSTGACSAGITGSGPSDDIGAYRPIILPSPRLFAKLSELHRRGEGFLFDDDFDNEHPIDADDPEERYPDGEFDG